MNSHHNRSTARFSVAFLTLFSIVLFPVHAKETEETIAERLDRAIHLLQSAEYPQAIEILDAVIALGPEAPPTRRLIAYSVRGDAHGLMSNYAAAHDDYSVAIEMLDRASVRPKLLSGLLKLRALAANELSSYESALQDLTRAVRLDPSDPAIANELGWAYATHPDSAFHDGLLAVHYATRACALTDFDNPMYLDSLAAAFARAGRYDQAIEYQTMTIAHPRFAKLVGPAEAELAASRLLRYKAGKPFQLNDPEAEVPAEAPADD